MAETLKVLAQAAPSAGVLTDAYTVGGSTTASVSSIVICNQSASADSVRVSVAISGAANAAKQYLYYDLPVPGFETFVATVGVTLGPADVVRVLSDNGSTTSFQLFGVEVT